MKESAARMRRTQQREQKILEAAMALFCEKGLEETSIDEIAGRAGVGSATIYRYYETKAQLAIQSGVEYWKKIAQQYLNLTEIKGYSDMTGLKQLECIMDALVMIFEKERGFLKYLQEFEVFVRRYEIDMERLAAYEESIMSLKPRVTDALEKGLQDGTLSFEWSPNEVCYSLAHTAFGVMKRFAWNGSMLELDSQVELILQVKIAIKLLIRGLTAGTA
ncbi:TetR/AcrR family transcriptional regulator [Mediterraneibacter glycyrrhizinilyticus]|uniref:TetR/AcrR family transcriptional regulator n=1 Tax=Candidatus Mediterraneibacter faecipullorum TaxID=2838670 RepID=A0A9D2NNR7_9FIRM|nr:TetR/AcrR family transcriptional regulator [Mediterraneibacter glycyrrhizinilyticus]MDM8124237.1 TetR/AcrR family transcriptional regulator [Mediterraneibacter glycyrrhizinilyticus]HJC34284.1 TetR/AcrR family transcriptional regulator [Candidatus Mediterraneibacter faecipullorum]